MAAKAGFSLSDLQQGAKRLNHTETKSSPVGSDILNGSKPSHEDNEALAKLETLYEKCDGDLDLIFKELNANPSKAKKPHHRPKGSKEFALKYLQGYYSVIEDDMSQADSKSHK